MKLETLEQMSEHDLLKLLCDINDGKVLLGPGDDVAVERAMWKRYMPEVSKDIPDEELLKLGKQFKEIVSEMTTAFNLGKV
jgi:hypothetical protein